jgi:hypothetical protein
VLKIQEWRERMKRIIKHLNETMNINFKCHPHIPQPRKNIYVLNIIIQSMLKERRNEGKGPQRNTQNLMSPIGV